MENNIMNTEEELQIRVVEKSYGRQQLIIKHGTVKDINQRDLSGDSPYNRSGKPYFNINIPENKALALYSDGWRIRKRGRDMTQLNKKGEPGKWVTTSDLDYPLEDWNYILELRIDYKSSRPTKIFRIIPMKEKRELFYNSPNKKTDINILKGDSVTGWNAIINAYKNPDDGIISGYLNELYMEVAPNEFEEMYSDLPLYTGEEGLDDDV